MKKLNLTIDISKINLAEKEKSKTPEELSKNVIENICKTYALNKGGLKKKERKLYYKVSDDLKKADKEVTLEDNRADFIEQAFNEAKFIPNPLTRAVEELVENMKEVN